MRVIALSTLRAFWTGKAAYADAREPTLAWYRHVLKADWRSPNEVKREFGSASILRDGRTVFNIAGNKYRIVVWHPRAVRQDRRADGLKRATIMEIKPIRTKADYRAALKEIAALMSAERDTPEGERLDVLVTLVEAYESRHYPLDLPDPVEAIRFRMEQKGLTPKDLVPLIGRINRVYEVLSRRRPLTLAMIQRLHSELGIPAESLIKQSERRRAA